MEEMNTKKSNALCQLFTCTTVSAASYKQARITRRSFYASVTPDFNSLLFHLRQSSPDTM